MAGCATNQQAQNQSPETTSVSAEPEQLDIAQASLSEEIGVAEADQADAIVVAENNVVVRDLPTSPDQNNVNLKSSAPEQYIVKEGDTLWDISSKFLNQPWFWPEIWYVNPQVANPHLIYPGDVINVFYVDGKPFLTVNKDTRAAALSNFERLSPSVRSEPINTEEKIIPIQAIEQFLIRPQVVTEEELQDSPHIVGSQDNRLVWGAGDDVYVRNSEHLSEGDTYNIFRPGGEFVDPDTGEILGYQAIHLGDGELMKEGDVGTLRLETTQREVLRGDRVLPITEIDPDNSFQPRPPNGPVNGKIIHLYEAISQVGTYQIVVTNVGEQDGIEKGNLVSIAQTGRTVSDPFAGKDDDAVVTFPDEETAVAMVFRIFDRVSYAFILDANRPVRIGDKVRNPE